MNLKNQLVLIGNCFPYFHQPFYLVKFFFPIHGISGRNVHCVCSWQSRQLINSSEIDFSVWLGGFLGENL